jgi:hypothetical protein
MIAGWRFWIFRCLLAEGLEDQHGALVTATFNALDAAHSGASGDPVGLCVLLDDDQRRRRPKAEWSDPRMIYAGYLRDGRQVRIAYFSAEVSSMATPEPEGGWAPGPGYRIEPFDQQTAVSAEDVIATWMSEGGLTRQEAERRIGELFLVATDADRRVAGITTAYLARNEQLQADMWYFRALVTAVHRQSNLGVSLAVAGRTRLIERFVSGEDRRGLGYLFEIENEGLKRYFPKGFWYESDILFIGETPRGAHVRVHYFPGVHAPEPSLGPARNDVPTRKR